MKKLLGMVVLCLTLLGLSPLGCFAAESEMDYSAAGWLVVGRARRQLRAGRQRGTARASQEQRHQSRRSGLHGQGRLLDADRLVADRLHLQSTNSR